MNENNTIPILMLIAFGIGIFFGTIIGERGTNVDLEKLQAEAIERNHAEWKVDNNEKGTTVFTWK